MNLFNLLGVEESPFDAIAQQKFFVYKVKQGELLYSIAKKYGCKMNTIAALNPQMHGQLCIKEGMDIMIPLKA